jgi:gas vesicle protein
MDMNESNGGGKFSYLLAGIGIGTIVGILVAPRPGRETREFLSQRADEARQRAQQKARELRERADDLVQRGREVVSEQVERGRQALNEQRDLLTGAVDAGREAYRQETSKEN